jgi:uncharacterized membrane protein YkoI
MTRLGVTFSATALGLVLGTVTLFRVADGGPAAPTSRLSGDIERAAELIKEKKIVSIGQALSCVPTQAHGQLLQVAFREKSEEANGRAVYEVYVLSTDRLIRVTVLDAASGEIVLQRRVGTLAKESREGAGKSSAAARSRFSGDVERAAELIKEKKIVSIGQALSCVPKQAHGQLLQVAFREKSEEANGRAVYEVYVLSEDRLTRVLLLDAASGDVLLERGVGFPAADR